jgi:hypothetical protein
MSGLGVRHVWQTPLELGLQGQMCPKIPGKLDWKKDFYYLHFTNSLDASPLIVRIS